MEKPAVNTGIFEIFIFLYAGEVFRFLEGDLLHSPVPKKIKGFTLGTRRLFRNEGTIKVSKQGQ
jgi:hypothetical protein